MLQLFCVFVLSEFYEDFCVFSFLGFCPDPVSQPVAEFFAEIKSHASRALSLSPVFSCERVFKDPAKVGLGDSYAVVPDRKKDSPGSPFGREADTGIFLFLIFYTVVQDLA